MACFIVVVDWRIPSPKGQLYKSIDFPRLPRHFFGMRLLMFAGDVDRSVTFCTCIFALTGVNLQFEHRGLQMGCLRYLQNCMTCRFITMLLLDACWYFPMIPYPWILTSKLHNARTSHAWRFTAGGDHIRPLWASKLGDRCKHWPGSYGGIAILNRQIFIHRLMTWQQKTSKAQPDG